LICKTGGPIAAWLESKVKNAAFLALAADGSELQATSRKPTRRNLSLLPAASGL
jgi:hypothetical protein